MSRRRDLMRVHDLTCAARAGNFRKRFQTRHKSQGFRGAIVKHAMVQIVCLMLAISLLCNSTPAAAQTIVTVSNDWSVSIAFWLQASGSLTTLKRLLAGDYLPKTNSQETQSDRDGRVRRIYISPGDVTARIGEVVRFSAIAYGDNGDTISGVNFRWRARGDNEGGAGISPSGEFSAVAHGRFTVSVSGAGRTAQ